VAWLTRESSKPGRGPIERWTIQASAEWSLEHLHDEPLRVQEKLLKAFAELTGIHARPSFAQAHRWHQAQTVKPQEKPFLWDATENLGICGDWLIGHRIEDAFLSGLQAALHLHESTRR
jgi:predicted NAD/FAD-dependent oxidoreductase